MYKQCSRKPTLSDNNNLQQKHNQKVKLITQLTIKCNQFAMHICAYTHIYIYLYVFLYISATVF